MNTGKLVDKSLLKTLVPPSALNMESFQELAGKALLEDIEPGKTIFKIGESDRRTTYLLEGQLSLIDKDGNTTTLVGGSPQAKHAVSNLQPRQHTARTKTACKITRFDSDLLDILLTNDQMSGSAGIEVRDLDEGGDEETDWMGRILQSPAFRQIPSANIQQLFMRMEEVPMRAGEVVIHQGDDGDFYYIIKTGKAKVTRKSKSGAELTLATLNNGDSFGEEALLSDAKRNASVTMVTDGSLMRLSKEDFNTLLKAPMLNWIPYEEAAKKVKEGAIWLDVRLDQEFQTNPLPGAMNLPLFMLRLKSDSLDPNKSYIVYCDTGRRSSAAAFLLHERGFDCYVMENGLNGVPA
jgi:CRP-like cAMP-binding protein